MNEFNSKDEFTWLLEFEDADIERRRANARTFHLPESGFHFIDQHFGPRPGCLHTLLGSTGRGKSTLISTLVAAWGKNAALLVYLSEESIERFEDKLAKMDSQASRLSPNLHVIHEQDILGAIKDTDLRGWFRMMRAKLSASNAKALIIDNLTTSVFYEGKFQQVTTLLGQLRKIAADFNIPVILVCHTKKGVNEHTKGLIQPDDVRGSASLGLTSDYFYIFYRFRKTVGMATMDGTFVYVSKSRDHDNQDRVYRLEYDANRRRYTHDKEVSFEIFKKFAKEKDKV